MPALMSHVYAKIVKNTQAVHCHFEYVKLTKHLDQLNKSYTTAYKLLSALAAAYILYLLLPCCRWPLMRLYLW